MFLCFMQAKQQTKTLECATDSIEPNKSNLIGIHCLNKLTNCLDTLCPGLVTIIIL